MVRFGENSISWKMSLGQPRRRLFWQAPVRTPQSHFHRLEDEFGAAAQKAILVSSGENSPKLFSSAGKRVWGSRSKGYSGELR